MVLVIAVGFWMGGKFLFSIHHYFLLSESAPATVSEWRVEEINSGKFAIVATFEFQAGGRTFYEHFRFPKPIYQNQYLSNALIEKWKGESWQVWYNPNDPHIASLQKSFPIKSGIYFVLCLGLFLYFSWLQAYVRRMNSLD